MYKQLSFDMCSWLNTYYIDLKQIQNPLQTLNVVLRDTKKFVICQVYIKYVYMQSSRKVLKCFEQIMPYRKLWDDFYLCRAISYTTETAFCSSGR